MRAQCGGLPRVPGGTRTEVRPRDFSAFSVVHGFVSRRLAEATSAERFTEAALLE